MLKRKKKDFIVMMWSVSILFLENFEFTHFIVLRKIDHNGSQFQLKIEYQLKVKVRHWFFKFVCSTYFGNPIFNGISQKE